MAPADSSWDESPFCLDRTRLSARGIVCNGRGSPNTRADVYGGTGSTESGSSASVGNAFPVPGGVRMSISPCSRRRESIARLHRMRSPQYPILLVDSDDWAPTDPAMRLLGRSPWCRDEVGIPRPRTSERFSIYRLSGLPRSGRDEPPQSPPLRSAASSHHSHHPPLFRDVRRDSARSPAQHDPAMAAGSDRQRAAPWRVERGGQGQGWRVWFRASTAALQSLRDFGFEGTSTTHHGMDPSTAGLSAARRWRCPGRRRGRDPVRRSGPRRRWR